LHWSGGELAKNVLFAKKGFSFQEEWRLEMISFVVMAAMSIAPEANAGIFKRRRGNAVPTCNACAAPVSPCNSCGGIPTMSASVALMPSGPALTPPSVMPLGQQNEFQPNRNSSVEARIEIPADLQDAIDKSDQKTQIADYLNNTSIPRATRLEYLQTVRQTLLVNVKD